MFTLTTPVSLPGNDVDRIEWTIDGKLLFAARAQETNVLDASGALIKGTPRHPIVEDDVVIYAGATVLGRVTIGKGASIGGNVWVTHDVAAGAQVTQARSQRDESLALL
mgnify:CR=1 FL=1